MKRRVIPRTTILSFPVGTPEPEVIRKLTEATLKFCGNNKVRTAQTLGISRRTIHRRLDTWSHPQGFDTVSAEKG